MFFIYLLAEWRHKKKIKISFCCASETSVRRLHLKENLNKESFGGFGTEAVGCKRWGVMQKDTKIGDFQFGQELTENVFFLLCGNQSYDDSKIKYSPCVHLAIDWPFWDSTQIQA